MKKFLVLSMTLLISFFACSCKKDNTVTKQGFYFDTVINITADESHLDTVGEAFEICENAENTFSRTKEGSELFLINSGKSTALTDEMKSILDFSLEVAEKSKGAFDVTVAPLSDLWNIKERTTPPSEDEILSALESTGYNKLTVEPFKKGDCTIDLGAVAKGYVADKIVSHFKKKGVKNAIIDLGGNVALIGKYTVGIRDPFNPENVFATIELEDKSAVTSGAYQRYYFEYNGTRYHHIIDPRTGKCADSGLSSVTVVSTSSKTADALSTAIYVLGEEGLSLCEKFSGTDALIITSDGEIVTTENFEKAYSLKIIRKN